MDEDTKPAPEKHLVVNSVLEETIQKYRNAKEWHRQAKGEDGLEFPHVFIRVSPKHMVDLSEHLLEDLRNSILRCTAVEPDRRFMHLWPEDA